MRETVVEARDAAGPVAARARQSALFGGERFCLQIDAHADVVARWDAELIDEWLRTENEYGVLSTYVHHIDRLPINDKHDDVPLICKTKWGEGGMVRNEQALTCVRLTRPKLTFSWGAGFSFSKCHALQQRVRYDPNLPHVFDGEEFSIAMVRARHPRPVVAHTLASASSPMGTTCTRRRAIWCFTTTRRCRATGRATWTRA